MRFSAQIVYHAMELYHARVIFRRLKYRGWWLSIEVQVPVSLTV